MDGLEAYPKPNGVGSTGYGVVVLADGSADGASDWAIVTADGTKIVSDAAARRDRALRLVLDTCFSSTTSLGDG